MMRLTTINRSRYVIFLVTILVCMKLKLGLDFKLDKSLDSFVTL